MEINHIVIHDEGTGSTNYGDQPYDVMFRTENTIDFTPPYEYLEEVSKNDNCPMEVYDQIGQLLAGDTVTVPFGSGHHDDIVRKA